MKKNIWVVALEKVAPIHLELGLGTEPVYHYF